MKKLKNSVSEIIDRTDNVLGCKNLKETLNLYSNYIDLKLENKIDIGNYNLIINCKTHGNEYKQVLNIINDLLIEKNIVKGKYKVLKDRKIKADTENKLYVIEINDRNIFENEVRDMVEKNLQNTFILLVNRENYLHDTKVFFKSFFYWELTIERITNEEKTEYIKGMVEKNNFMIKENSRFIDQLADEMVFDINQGLMKAFVQANNDNTNILQDKYFKLEDSKADTIKIMHGLEKLDKLIGLANVKEQIQQIVDYVEVHKKRGNMPMLHMVFTGNPRNWKNISCKNNWRDIF